VLSPDAPLANAVQHILAGSQEDFPIVQDEQVVGVLTKGNLFSGLNKYGDQVKIEQVMERDFTTADTHEMLEIAFAHLQDCGCHTVPVLHNSQLVGLLTMDNIGEFMRIQSTLKTAV
jgi:predicted transcriptional regulator